MRNIIIIQLLIVLIKAKSVVILTDGPIEWIGPRLYKKELLTNIYKDPIELAYDSATRNLFFMHMDPVLLNSGRAYINIITKESKKIEGITRNKATAVDADTGEVYFGSNDGLYIYDPLTNSARNIGLYNVNVLKIVIRDNNMYIIDANNHMLYKVNGKEVRKLGNAKTVINFDIDGNKNVHFLTICGVFCAVKGDEIVKNKDINVAYNFIVDLNKTYAITDDGVQEIDCANGTAHKVADLSFRPRSIIFGDYGDIFYSSDDSIYRLKPITSYVLYNISRKRGT
ncbi:PREDICTED: ommochrome-binding protein-like [Papilio polytes]|uniref:ommochrome-binding protein-like n=1 Tax=Papilio polytes TaxID=76194 RepID=UPI000675EFEB|nr:PREDICTED: ommochrome-binding protein-like [Papilio polytes]